jgi:HAE1 family hydrophobic/amphiphilic exporter-1
MTTLVSLAVVIFGVSAYRFLPVSDLPNVDYPTILVNAGLPGGSPEMMASAVATPLEREFSTIAGVAQMTSTSTQGQTSITLQFDLTRNLDAAAQDVQSKISAAESQLPAGMPSPPSYEKVNPSDNAIIYIGMSSATLPLSTVDSAQANRPRIRQCAERQGRRMGARQTCGGARDSAPAWYEHR